MQNKNQKTKFSRCENYEKYEYKKSSYAETYEVLQSLREDEVFCDIKLETDNSKIINAHKVVLASASPYFYAMFINFSERNRDLVVMRRIDSTALQLLVNFIYSGVVVVTEENVQVLLPAANLLQLEEVKGACCDFLQSQLCPANCIGINAIADLHSCMELLTSSELYIQQHFLEVADGDDFLSLSTEQLIKLISSDKLVVPSEENIFECVLRWVKHDLGSRKCILPQLMEHVRLPLTSKNYILKNVVEEPLIKNCIKCKEYINEAFNFHRLKSEDLIPQSIRYKPRQEDKVILAVDGMDTKLSKVIEFFEPKLSQWHSGPQMITSRKNAGLAVVKDNLVYAVGGSTDSFEPLRSVDVLDLSSELPCWKPSVDMLVKRNILGVGVINNCLYAVGGHNYSDSALDSAEVFDNNTQKWCMISNMSTRRSDPGIAVLNNLLYAIGGFDQSSLQTFDTVECYDPSIDKWTPVAKMCGRRRGFGVGVIDGVLYAVGGHDGFNCLSSVEAYRPSTGVWTTIADMNFTRLHAGVVASGGLLYVIGGSYNGCIVDSTEYYSPKTNTWTIVTESKNYPHTSGGIVGINMPRHFKTCYFL